MRSSRRDNRKIPGKYQEKNTTEQIPKGNPIFCIDKGKTTGI
jgi:hypothetical protein